MKHIQNTITSWEQKDKCIVFKKNTVKPGDLFITTYTESSDEWLVLYREVTPQLPTAARWVTLFCSSFSRQCELRYFYDSEVLVCDLVIRAG